MYIFGKRITIIAVSLFVVLSVLVICFAVVKTKTPDKQSPTEIPTSTGADLKIKIPDRYSVTEAQKCTRAIFGREYSVLVICDFDKDNLTLTSEKRITIDSNIAGRLVFNEDNVLCIVNTDTIYWFDEFSHSFNQKKTETGLNASAYSQRMDKLQQAVIKLWNDGSVNAVGSINWFSN